MNQQMSKVLTGNFNFTQVCATAREAAVYEAAFEDSLEGVINTECGSPHDCWRQAVRLYLAAALVATLAANSYLGPTQGADFDLKYPGARPCKVLG